MSNKSAHSILDETDLRILSHLQENARASKVAVAEAAHLSPAPCLRRMRELENSGVIRSYVTLLDPEAVGLEISMFIQISLEKQVESAMRRFEELIHSYPEVMECYLMTGDSDYLLRVVAKDLHSLQRLIVERLANIPHVSNIRSSITLKQVKYKTALPLELDTRSV